MSEQTWTPAHMFGMTVVLLCEQRVRAPGSIAYWPGRLTVLAAKALLKKATVAGLDTKAIWAEFEERGEAPGVDAGAC